ncbi:MAG: hypothetical protein A3E80_04780 [Chlamydiae bacterium RIFCSPHIGHO2_12_FULL_49_9]|nr:MAG: hypothetical protein A3E80_04780 [Chlamydiae bacterium RIFCSPHIGHO2_12_FULL_49_9]
MKKIVRISRLLKWASLSACCALPLIEAGYWITNGYPFLEPFFHSDMLPTFGGVSLGWAGLNETQKLLCFLINMVPTAFYMISLGCLSQLFAAFERLEFFEKSNVQTLKRAGWALVWGQIAHPLYTMCLSLALTYRNPVGERMISIALGSDQVKILAIGLSILLVSWVFEEAVKIQEEQTGTI